MDALTIRPARADEPGVRAVLEAHFTLMRAGSPEESCHVMTPDALTEAGAQLLAAELGGEVVGVGALKRIGADHGELKSMHTLAVARGQGVARAILRRLIDLARSEGMTRVSLETGTDPAFGPARALYMAHGFSVCAPFGDYQSDPLSVFMTQTLD